MCGTDTTVDQKNDETWYVFIYFNPSEYVKVWLENSVEPVRPRVSSGKCEREMPTLFRQSLAWQSVRTVSTEDTGASH